MEDALLYAVIAIVAFIITMAICYYIFRWIFSIKRQLWNQRQIIMLLSAIALKLAPEHEKDIEEIVNKLDVEDQYLK